MGGSSLDSKFEIRKIAQVINKFSYQKKQDGVEYNMIAIVTELGLWNGANSLILLILASFRI